MEHTHTLPGIQPTTRTYEMRVSDAFYEIENLCTDYKQIQFKKYNDDMLSRKILNRHLNTITILKTIKHLILTNYKTLEEFNEFVKNIDSDDSLIYIKQCKYRDRLIIDIKTLHL